MTLSGDFTPSGARIIKAREGIMRVYERGYNNGVLTGKAVSPVVGTPANNAPKTNFTQILKGLNEQNTKIQEQEIASQEAKQITNSDAQRVQDEHSKIQHLLSRRQDFYFGEVDRSSFR